MTAKLSEESVNLMMEMFRSGNAAKDISKAVGCATSTVVRYLNEAGIVLGNKGRTKELTDEYFDLAMSMRSQGVSWEAVGKKIGFSHKTFQAEARLRRAKAMSQ